MAVEEVGGRLRRGEKEERKEEACLRKEGEARPLYRIWSVSFPNHSLEILLPSEGGKSGENGGGRLSEEEAPMGEEGGGYKHK